MNLLKNVKVIVTLILGLLAIGVLISYCSRIPSNEITRSQLLQFVKDKRVTGAAVTPMIYPGIFSIEGHYVASAGGLPKTFTISTHLDEKELEQLLAQTNVNVDVP